MNDVNAIASHSCSLDRSDEGALGESAHEDRHALRVVQPGPQFRPGGENLAEGVEGRLFSTARSEDGSVGDNRQYETG